MQIIITQPRTHVIIVLNTVELYSIYTRQALPLLCFILLRPSSPIYDFRFVYMHSTILTISITLYSLPNIPAKIACSAIGMFEVEITCENIEPP